MRGSLGFGVDLRLTNSGGLDADAQSFVSRVTADGGTVEDQVFLNNFILNAKQNNYFYDIVAAYSPSWGYKIGTGVSDLYSITGATHDIQQSTTSKQPSVLSGDLNGKSRLDFDSAAVECFELATFTWNQPATVVFGGFQQKTWGSLRLMDGGTTDQSSILQSPSTPNLRLSAGATAVIDGNTPVATDVHFRALFNGAASAIQVDNNAATVGDAGANNPGGFTLNCRGNGTLAADVKHGMVVLLSAAVDGDYSAKMSALYNFSKNIYGTS